MGLFKQPPGFQQDTHTHHYAFILGAALTKAAPAFLFPN